MAAEERRSGGDIVDKAKRAEITIHDEDTNFV